MDVLVTGSDSAEHTMSSDGAKYTLTYWDIRAYGEPVRMALALSGEAWVDRRLPVGPPPSYDKGGWAEEKEALTEEVAFPNLPHLEVHGGDAEPVRRLTQTRAILRFLARRHGFDGTAGGDAAVVNADAVTEGAMDAWDNMYDATYCDSIASGAPAHVEGADQCMPTPAWDEARRVYVSEALPRNLARFDAVLRLRRRESEVGAAAGKSSAASADGAGIDANLWMAGPVHTYADLVVFEILDESLALAPDSLAPFPRLAAYHARVAAIPAIAEYRAGGGRGGTFKSEPLHSRYSHFYKAPPATTTADTASAADAGGT